ncbi:MAG TPA: cytochrome c [Candidatus Sulfotelmatobacter sp.]|nr:cytochrome c [Candidatus Sulfotelmatobacter sp.]
MKTTRHLKLSSALLFALAFGSYVFAAGESKKDSSKDYSAAPVVHNYDADAMRVQGEQRFRANCGRCHAAPQKFPPRMMATVLRHMRVRATITDQDMRLILFYMTQ